MENVLASTGVIIATTMPSQPPPAQRILQKILREPAIVRQKPFGKRR
jgi:hypothetical protein